MDIRVNELDLTRAGVISVQRSLPATETSWQVDYSIGDVMYRVQGSAFHGRPHGQDADVLLALQTLFFRAGCPDNNSVEVTAAALLALSGHAKNGQYYTRLRESLLRLWGVKWTMVRTRWDEQQSQHRGDTTATSLIAELRLVDQAGGHHRPFEAREISESSPIEVTLVPSFAASIRAGLFQILDGELLSRLGQPQARSLYRVLQAHRVTSDGSLASELQFVLRDWLTACGLEEERMDNAKRMLDLAHERLKNEGYLHEVVYQGRGRAGSVTYTFLAAPEPEVVDRLLERGVTRPVAEALAADHPQRITPALRVIDERLRTGWKPRSLAASVVDAVRNPSKWGYEGAHSPVKAPVKKSKASPAQPVPEPAADPKETALILLKLKLGRSPSAAALEAVDSLDTRQMELLMDALKRTKGEALPLVRALLCAEL
jgi:plasmid replication initiation protein